MFEFATVHSYINWANVLWTVIYTVITSNFILIATNYQSDFGSSSRLHFQPPTRQCVSTTTMTSLFIFSAHLLCHELCFRNCCSLDYHYVQCSQVSVLLFSHWSRKNSTAEWVQGRQRCPPEQKASAWWHQTPAATLDTTSWSHTSCCNQMLIIVLTFTS